MGKASQCHYFGTQKSHKVEGRKKLYKYNSPKSVKRGRKKKVWCECLWGAVLKLGRLCMRSSVVMSSLCTRLGIKHLLYKHLFLFKPRHSLGAALLSMWECDKATHSEIISMLILKLQVNEHQTAGCGVCVCVFCCWEDKVDTNSLMVKVNGKSLRFLCMCVCV